MIETEEDILRRKCRELYDELLAKEMIDGTYEEWLKDATEKAAKKIDPPRIVVP